MIAWLDMERRTLMLLHFTRTRLVASACFIVVLPIAAGAQDVVVPASQPEAETDTQADTEADPGEPSFEDDPADGIIVEGQRLRGQLDVEQAPILELDEEDIAVEGVASIADLISQITARTGSARGRGGGGRPVILINGIRVGSFREFAQYPPEALARVEVFPEEVAQRFGFPPDRRVINLILKDNYRNAEIELEFEGPSRGGNYTREQEIGFLQIADGARINFNFTAQDTSLLTEDERDIIQTPGSISDVAGDPDQAPFRSLVPDSRSLEANLSWAKTIIDSGMSLSANANFDRSDRLSLQGLNTVVLTDDPDNPDAGVLRTFGEATPLAQRISSDTLSTSGSLSAPVNAFRLTSTFDASLDETTQEIDRRFDISPLLEAALAGTLALDGPLPSDAGAGFDTAFTRALNASNLTTLRGPLLYVPAGEVTATFDLGYDWTRLETEDTRGSVPVELTRGDLSTGVNLVVPITSRRNGFADALGSFTFNAQLGLQYLSDFGTLGDYTLGLTWAPTDNLDLSVNYIEREVAPTLAQLGDPRIINLNIPVFDFTNDETVLATVITGGNTDLLAETQADWKFAANWELPFWDNTRLTLEYITNRSEDVTNAFPQITPEIEAAFPGRIVRDDAGRLLEVDRRFVTFAETRADRIQIGLTTSGTFGEGAASARGGNAESGRGQQAGRARPPGGGRDSPAGAGNATPGEPNSGPPTAIQRSAFLDFRTRLCAEDGLDVLTRLVEASAKGEDLSAIIPGFDASRFERLLTQVRSDNGNVDPVRLAALRERICSFDPATIGEGEGGGEPGNRPDAVPREGFAAFRIIACADDGVERLATLIARIEAGEDVSAEIPGFDPNTARFIIDQLRGEDGNISAERLEAARGRICASEQGEGGGDASAAGGGGPPAVSFNPLSGDSFRGFRYFASLNHTIELENTILIASGLAPLDQLDGDATGAFGLPRNTTRLEAGIFGAGIGVRLSGRYTGEAALNGTGAGSNIFFEDLATFDIRVFSELDELLGSESPWLENLRLSLRADNVLDAQRRVVDESGVTPLNYQPFLIDPVGRFIGVDIRKLF
ncbi:MAG: hypothetical protein V2J51_05700 [Erythrobacter sp.]|jgi:hypothetical protein|nr:hypothetical protein [Erythrobacter sp.]